MQSSLTPLATDYGLPPPDLAAARLSDTYSPDSRLDRTALSWRCTVLAAKAATLSDAEAEATQSEIDAIEAAVVALERRFWPRGGL
jgi:hypothetical protein